MATHVGKPRGRGHTGDAQEVDDPVEDDPIMGKQLGLVPRQEFRRRRCFQQRHQSVVPELGGHVGLGDGRAEQTVRCRRVTVDQFGNPLPVRAADRRMRAYR